MRHLRGLVWAHLVVAATLCLPTGVAALTVTNLSDSNPGSLRDAIANTPPGGTIDFAPGLSGSIALATSLTIAKSLTIVGPGAAIIVVSGNGAVRVIDLTAGTLNLSGLTIANGLSAGLGGGIQVGTGTTLNVSQCTFGDNTASNGGALSISAGGTATIDECTFDTNVTTSVGGGALITFGTTTVKNSTFVHNTAPINGGAINVQPAGTLTLLNSTLFDNTSGSLGGAMSNLGTVTAINNTFAANHGSSGAAIATANPNVTIYNNVFADNVGSGSPSALSPDGSFPASSHNVFFNNNVAGVPDDQTGYGTTNPIIASAQPLQPLGDNGGPTQTMLPVPGGAAICAGSVALVPGDLDRDQRGFPRITRHGTCVDAGSVQGAEAIPVLSTPLFVVLAGLLIAVGLRHASRRGRARLA